MLPHGYCIKHGWPLHLYAIFEGNVHVLFPCFRTLVHNSINLTSLLDNVVRTFREKGLYVWILDKLCK